METRTRLLSLFSHHHHHHIAPPSSQLIEPQLTHSPYIHKPLPPLLNFSPPLSLKQQIPNPLPSRETRNLLPRRINNLPIRHPPIRINIDVTRPQPSLRLPKVSRDPEDQDNGESEVGFEEILGCTDAGDPKWGEGCVELLLVVVLDRCI